MGDLLAGLRRSWLLLAYLVLGVLAAVLISPRSAVSDALLDLLLVPVVLVVWRVTRGRPTLPEERPQRSGGDLLVIAVVYLLGLGINSWVFFGGGLAVVWRAALELHALGMDSTLSDYAAGVAPPLAYLALSIALTLGAFRLRPASVGLRPRGLLLGTGMSIAILVPALLASPAAGPRHLGPSAILERFVSELLAAGAPEEFAFRGVILLRLERLLGNWQHALVLSSLFWVSSHLPTFLYYGSGLPWWTVVLQLFTSGVPPAAGVGLGYLCHRTRSIWPGAMVHATGNVIGF